VPHNFLSTAFVDLEDEIEKGNITYEDFQNLLFIIAFSHDRDFDVDFQYFNKYICEDVSKYIENQTLKPLLELLPSVPDRYKMVESSNYTYRVINQLRELMLKDSYDLSDKKVVFRILLKGLLHRLDHSSSAGINAEEAKINDFPEKVEVYLKRKGSFTGFKNFQKKAIELSEKSVVLFAPTGSGKTEFGLNWAFKSKLIYTLPIRVSINAMYEYIYLKNIWIWSAEIKN
jgi:CRISPR-associated endonuclease/helicase Cas3